MLKKVLTVLVCSALTAGCMISCGKEITVDDDPESSVSESSKNNEDSASEGSKNNESSPVANITAPENGEQIIVMKVKGYDGEIKIKLFPEYADKGVENFVELAKKGYYDGLTFHRVIKDFMIQGGDPLGTGTGGESIWGDKFEGGTDPHLIHMSGAVAYANSGATSTNGSQFYIVTGTSYDEETLDQMAAYYGLDMSDEVKNLYTTIGGAPWLDGGYTVFGQVFEGLDIVYDIQNVAVNEANSMPLESVIMESVKVAEYNGEDLNWYIEDYE